MLPIIDDVKRNTPIIIEIESSFIDKHNNNINLFDIHLSLFINYNLFFRTYFIELKQIYPNKFVKKNLSIDELLAI